MGEQSEKTATQTVAPEGVLGWTVHILSKIVDPLTSKIGMSIAGVFLTLIMAITFFDVAGRVFFKKPISGSLELTEFMMGIMVAFGIAYTAFRKGHIRVDIVMQFASRKANLWMDIFAYGTSMVFFIFITWQTWLNALSVMNTKLASVVLLLPTYPFVFIVAIGSVCVVLILLRDFLNAIKEVSR